MKKTLLSLVTVGLFLAGLLLTNLRAYASGQTWQVVYTDCFYDHNISIKTCGVGSETTCTPYGTCPTKAVQ